MRNTCILSLSNETNYPKLFQTIENIQSGVVFIIFKDDFRYTDHDNKVREILKRIHDLKKNVMIVLNNEFFIEEGDFFIVYRKEVLSKNFFLKLSKERKPVLIKLSGTAYEIFQDYSSIKEMIDFTGFSKYSFLFDLESGDLVEYAFDPEEVFLIDSPACISSKFGLKNTYRDLLDVREIIEKDKFTPVDETFDTILQHLKKNQNCFKCKSTTKCLGTKKHERLTPLSDSSLPVPISQIVKKSSSKFSIGSFSFSGDINFKTKDDNLTKRELEILQNCRKGNLEDFDFYHVWSLEKSVFFNRRRESNSIFNIDPRGLNSIDITFIGKDILDLQYKLKQDLLLPKHGLAVMCKVKFDDSWSEERMKKLDDFTMNTIIRIIVENGGDPSCVEQRGNDLLYNGKKFCGKEWKFLPPYGYIENTVLTTEYLPEKQWFDQLYHYEGEKQITGITEEVPSVTKELLISELVRIAKETFND